MTRVYTCAHWTVLYGTVYTSTGGGASWLADTKTGLATQSPTGSRANHSIGECFQHFGYAILVGQYSDQCVGDLFPAISV